MKTIKFSIIILSILSLSLLYSCGGGGNEEPNNTIEEAVAIDFDKPIDFSINPVEDIDWFKFEVKERGYVRALVNNVPEGLSIEIRFAKLKEWEGEKEDWISDWREVPTALTIAEAGTYYIALKDEYNDKENKASMQLKIEFIKEFDEFEDNNTIENAKKIELGSNFKAAIFPQNDQEWFKVIADKPGYMRIQSKDVPENVNLEVSYYIYDEWADPKLTKIRNNEEMPSACFFPKAGEYYFLLNDEYNDKLSTDLFDLKIEYLDLKDLTEPNNLFPEAKEVKKGDTLNLSIYPVGDIDYYKINITSADTLKFYAKGFTELQPTVQLFSINPEKEDELIKKCDEKDIPAKIEVAAGEYYILIRDEYNDNANYENFVIRIE